MPCRRAGARRISALGASGSLHLRDLPCGCPAETRGDCSRARGPEITRDVSRSRAERPTGVAVGAVRLEAVQKDRLVLAYVSTLLRTEALCHATVEQNVLAFEYVPERYKTSEWCQEVVHRLPYALRFVSWPLRTQALCMEAVKKDGTVLRFVPEELKTRELCLAAVRKPGGRGNRSSCTSCHESCAPRRFAGRPFRPTGAPSLRSSRLVSRAGWCRGAFPRGLYGRSAATVESFLWHFKRSLRNGDALSLCLGSATSSLQAGS